MNLDLEMLPFIYICKVLLCRVNLQRLNIVFFFYFGELISITYYCVKYLITCPSTKQTSLVEFNLSILACKDYKENFLNRLLQFYIIFLSLLSSFILIATANISIHIITFFPLILIKF